MRAELRIALSSATALTSRSRPTISSTNAFCAGSSTTVTSPSAPANANTIQTCTTSVSTTSQSTTASTAASDWVTIEHLPPVEAVGDRPAPETEQQHGEEPERERGADRGAAAGELETSQASAIVCIQPPTYETRSPAK